MLTAFKSKLKLWKRKMEEGENVFFPFLSLVLDGEAVSFIDVQNIVVEHLTKLSIEFDRYIPENVVLNPFSVDVEDLPKELSSINKLQE